MTHSQDQNQQKAYQERVIQARFKLMQRFKKQMADSPSLSDDQP